MEVELLCNKCKAPFTKSLSYLKGRVREKRYKFFCSRVCANLSHSNSMSGERNPNFNGIFRGKTMADLTPEERKDRARKISESAIRNGSNAGSNNGRWSGGRRDVTCIICGTEYKVRPYRYRSIESGKTKPCCDHNCARIYGQTQVKKSRTSIEVKMADELARRQIEYIEQYNLGNKFALDFFLPEYGIVIECDGDYWHTLPDVAKRDRSKNAYIRACGHTLFRFWEHEINECVEACVDIVLAKINEMEAVV